MYSVSVNPAGFTVVSPDTSSRIIYVSESLGSDQNNGLTTSSPIASLGRAEALVRDHSSDQILLKAGDTWNSGFEAWTKSGLDVQHPILIGSYGVGLRPLILTGDVRSAFSTAGNSAISNLVISGLQFRSDVRDPASSSFSVDAGQQQDSGFRWYAPTSGFLLQDCSFQYYSDNLDIEGLNGPISGVNIFRCESLDSYTTSGGAYRSQGLYGYNLNGISITQSLFDHDGWSETIPNAGRSGYDHDIYLSSTVLNASIQDNVIANASNNGLLARGGGDIENNFFLDNPSAISYGASPGSMSAVGGVHGAIIGNVIMGDACINGESFGYGITIANTAPGTPTLVANNVFTGDTEQSKPAIELTAVSNTDNPADCVGINDLVVQNNLFNDWYRPLAIDSILQSGSVGLTALNDVSIQNNEFENAGDYLVRYDTEFSNTALKWNSNTYTDSRNGNWFELDGSVLDFAQWKAKVESTAVDRTIHYPDGAATQASYVATIGGGSTSADFLTNERAQSSGNWNPEYLAGAVNDYLRNAFGVPTTPIAVATAAAVNASDTYTVSAGGSVGQTPYIFSVSYSDTQSLNVSSIASGNVTVTGPDNFNEPATLMSVSPSIDGKSAVAVYSITPPGGNWSGTADGTYTIDMQAAQVRNGAGIAVAQGSIGKFDVSLPLFVYGTSGNDQISVRAAQGCLIVTVNHVATIYALTDVPELEIEAGSGNDRVSIAAHVVPTLIDGGAGNDVIQTNNGNDTLLGDDGNDILKATGGHNLLIGGTGDDQLISAGIGPNLLDGGDGNDRLHGGSGDDVLIGGTGADHLQAGRGNQLLLAAVPDTDDPASLLGILNSWANGQPYSSRTAVLAPTGGTNAMGEAFSIAGVSFGPDFSPDSLIGGLRQDWFVVSSYDHLIHKTTVEVATDID